MTPSFVTPMPFRIDAPGIGYARPGWPVFRSNVRTVSMSAAYSVLPEIALPSGWFSVSPSRVAPIHLLVLTLPSGLISDTKPSFCAMVCGFAAFIATIMLRAGSNVQLSEKLKLP